MSLTFKKFALVPIAVAERYRKLESTNTETKLPAELPTADSSRDDQDLLEAQIGLVPKRQRNRARALLFLLKEKIVVNEQGRVVLQGSPGPHLYSVLKYLTSQQGYRPPKPIGIEKILPLLANTEFEQASRESPPVQKTKWAKLYQ